MHGSFLNLGTGGSFSHSVVCLNRDVYKPYFMPVLPLYLGGDNWFSRFAGTQMERNGVPGIIPGPSLILDLDDLNEVWEFGAGATQIRFCTSML